MPRADSSRAVSAPAPAGRVRGVLTRRRLLALLGWGSSVALLSAGCRHKRSAPAVSTTAAPGSPSPPPPVPTAGVVVCQVTLLTGTTRLAIVDPITGGAVPALNPPEILAASAVVGGYGGILYFSSEATDGSTAVLALDAATGERAEIGRVATPALAQALAPAGDRLFLAAFAEHGDVPDALPAVPIPARWRPTPAPGPTPAREAGVRGVVSQDGRRWYHLSGLGDRGSLEIVEFSDRGPPARVRLQIPSPYNYYTLLAAPDDRTLYVIDYRNAMTVRVVDVARHAIVRSVATRAGGGTKGTPWSAALAPDGTRLYVIGTDEERGIDVIDTASLQRVTSFVPGQPFAQLVVSPDGRSLYATAYMQSASGMRIATIDTRTGDELRTAVMRAGAFIPLLATDAHPSPQQ
jgi:hypothetical protein